MDEKRPHATRVAIIGHGHDIAAIRALHRTPDNIEIVCVNDASEVPGFISQDLLIRHGLDLETVRIPEIEFVSDIEPKRRGWERPYKYHK